MCIFRNEDVRYLNESAVDSVCQKLSVVTELAEQLDFTLSGLAQSTVTRVLDDSSGNVTQASFSIIKIPTVRSKFVNIDSRWILHKKKKNNKYCIKYLFFIKKKVNFNSTLVPKIYLLIPNYNVY